jgi:DNA-binding MarR family transcriptional regulator
MSDGLSKEIRQSRRFGSLEEQTFLSVQRTAGLWMQALTTRLRPSGLTPTQYNVLRILRGADPDSLTCGEIGERMVTPVPDVTRMVDRLIAHGWAFKARDDKDRRVVRVEIAREGQELLASLDDTVLGWLEELLAPLEPEDMRALGELARKARSH